MAMSKMKQVFEAVLSIADAHGIDTSDDAVMIAMADAYIAGGLAYNVQIQTAMFGGK